MPAGWRRPVQSQFLALLLLPILFGQLPAQNRNPLSFAAGDWTVSLGGYVKLDAIHDFDPIASTDQFDPRDIPVNRGEGSDTRVFGRESRISLSLNGPAQGRELKILFEGDFFGPGNGFRLRHAYGQYGVLLAGQTWSTFMDELNIPPTIDFETPLAAPLTRQGLIRASPRLSKQVELGLAVEESDPEILIPAGRSGTIEKQLPDLIARVRYTGSWGHAQLSGFVGRTQFRPDSGEASAVTIGGALLSIQLRPVPRDAAYVEIAYGPGVGRYRGAASAGFNRTGQLKTVDAVGLTVGYEHYWTPRWSTNVVASPAWITSNLGDPASTNDRFDYVAANLKYWFLEGQAWSGLEYLYGRRRLRSGTEGSANRMQFAISFNLPQ